MDIISGKSYPASALSNFAPHPFEYDGVEIASMEGFLQGLKFSNPDMQAHICTLVGRAAKKRGAGKNWQRTGKLYWMECQIDRFSPEYQLLLDRVFETLLSQNVSAQNALLATGSAVLKHSIGKKNMKETVLTRSEFCTRLTALRQRFMFAHIPRTSVET